MVLIFIFIFIYLASTDAAEEDVRIVLSELIVSVSVFPLFLAT